jgi:hypothetical protein
MTMTKDDTKNVKIVAEGDDPEPRHGGDWFWGDNPPDLVEPTAKKGEPEPQPKK